MPKEALGPDGWFVPGNPRARGSRDAWVAMFPPAGASGVYAIASRDTCDGRGRCRVLYVGMSETGRLRKTLARHFQSWDDPRQERFTYDRNRVVITWEETDPEEAKPTEYDWRRILDPRDNPLVDDLEEVEGPDLTDDEIPF